MGLLLVADERVLDHRPPEGHPERPERVVAALHGIERAGFGDALIRRTPEPAPVSALVAVHSPTHVDTIDAFGRRDHVRIDADTHMSSGSLLAARLAAGAGLDAIAALDAGEAESAFCVVRPPGHHATPDRAMGFCLFNNIAVTAQALAARGEKVAIVDFDAHHGNGTQDVFFGRDDVLFVSLHEYPQYPGTGAATEIGSGAGHGHTINVPLPSGATGDVYLEAIDRIVIPALEKFDADWLLISAGFDAHRADPLTDLGLTSGDYADICKRLVDSSTAGRRIAFLEGGYDLDALADSSATLVASMLGVEHRPESSTSGGPGRDVVDAVAEYRESVAEAEPTA